MLVIRQEQMSLLEKEIRKADENQIRNDLAQKFPILTESELDDFVKTGFKKTEKYGIDEDAPVKDFIRLMIIVARDFDDYPKAQEQLKREDVDPNLSVRLMIELLTPAEWREAESYGTKLNLGNQKYYV